MTDQSSTSITLNVTLTGRDLERFQALAEKREVELETLAADLIRHGVTLAELHDATLEIMLSPDEKQADAPLERQKLLQRRRTNKKNQNT